MFDELIESLKTIGIPVTAYAWDVRPDCDNIIVSHSAIDSSLHGDDRMIEQAPQGYIDLFSPTASREHMQAVQDILNNTEGLAWYLNVVDYEPDTRLMHWQWAFSTIAW